MVKPSYAEATPHSRWQDLFCWVSHRASARACLGGLTSDGWDGHEAFYIVAPDICWEGSSGPSGSSGQAGSTGREAPGEAASPEIPGARGVEGKVGTLQLLDEVMAQGGVWEGRIKEVRREWWDGQGRERRGVFRTTRAETMLGWYHE